MPLSIVAPPFIGIAGVKTLAEAQAIQQLVRKLGIPAGRRCAMGVLSSYRGLVFNEVADPTQYVLPHELNALMLRDRDLLNVLHYNSRADGLPRQVHNLLRRVQYADAVQLNVVWPAPEQMERLRWETYAPVILQIGAAAFATAGSTTQGIIERLRQYVREPADGTGEAMSLVEYVLFDLSGGLGFSLDPEMTARVLTELVASGLPMRWGVAGGLGPDNVAAKIVPLLEIDSHLSWDAQSSLRTADNMALDLDKCEAFLQASFEVVRASLALAT